MDAWNADQLRKMQAGGNSKLNDFFKQYGVDKATDIKLKYSNRVAEVHSGCSCPCRIRRMLKLWCPAACWSWEVPAADQWYSLYLPVYPVINIAGRTSTCQ